MRCLNEFKRVELTVLSAIQWKLAPARNLSFSPTSNWELKSSDFFAFQNQTCYQLEPPNICVHLVVNFSASERTPSSTIVCLVLPAREKRLLSHLIITSTSTTCRGFLTPKTGKFRSNWCFRARRTRNSSPFHESRKQTGGKIFICQTLPSHRRHKPSCVREASLFGAFPTTTSSWF